MLHKDEWLSTYFKNGAYSYKAPFSAELPSQGFIFSKVPCDQVEAVESLCAMGFNVVEVLVKFQQKQSIESNQTGHNVRFSQQEDKDQVVQIAYDAFECSRLYQDSLISYETASNIKADWVGNFYNGARGTHMIVATEGKRITGFLLLIDNVIDLISVSKDDGQKGIASAMIAYANKEVGVLSAGTQIINKPSIALYQKCGFVMQSAEYVLHNHKA